MLGKWTDGRKSCRHPTLTPFLVGVSCHTIIPTHTTDHKMTVLIIQMSDSIAKDVVMENQILKAATGIKYYCTIRPTINNLPKCIW